MPQRPRLLPALLLLATACALAPALAQTALPLRPSNQPPVLAASVGSDNWWRIGPLALKLPAAWTVTATPTGAQIDTDADKARLVVTVLRATSEARRNGYSLLDDPVRGPAQAATYADPAGICRAKPPVTRMGVPAPRQLYVVACEVPPESNQPAYFMTYSLYAKNHLALVGVAGKGTVQDGHALLDAIVAGHGWDDEL